MQSVNCFPDDCILLKACHVSVKKTTGFSQTHWGKKEVPTNFEPTQRIRNTSVSKRKFAVQDCHYYLLVFFKGEGYLCSECNTLSMEYLFCLRSEAYQIWGTSFSQIIRLEKIFCKFMTKSLSFPISMVFNCCCILVFLVSVLLDWISQNNTPGQPQMFLPTASSTLELPPAGSPCKLMRTSGLPKPHDGCKSKFVPSTAHRPPTP